MLILLLNFISTTTFIFVCKIDENITRYRICGIFLWELCLLGLLLKLTNTEEKRVYTLESEWTGYNFFLNFDKYPCQKSSRI